VASEGSVEQNRDLTNRKRTRGISGRTSGRLITKSISIKDQGCRSDRGAGKAIELTWGGLRCVPSSELGEPRGDPTAAQKSADGIVGQAVGKASDALQGRKTEQQIGRAPASPWRYICRSSQGPGPAAEATEDSDVAG
jgi:hypothetical protein